MSKFKAISYTVGFLVFCAICVGIICMVPPEPLIHCIVGIGLVIVVGIVSEFIYDVLRKE